MRHLLILIFSAVLLAACGAFSGEDAALRKNPNYQQGYDDGCAAASTSGANPRETLHRDDALYESDKAYHTGWSSGFSTCRSQTVGNPLDNPGISPLPGHH